MSSWLTIFEFIVIKTIGVCLDPMFWMIMLLVAWQYWQARKRQKAMFGVVTFSMRQHLGYMFLYGIVGGLLGGALLALLGVSFNAMGFSYVWPLAVLLMIASARFICFAYAGGLVALSSAIFGWPVVNVPHLLSLVAVLHVVESILIVLSGRYGDLPSFLRRRDGRVVGAFQLQNFWPLPLVLLMAVAVPEGDARGLTLGASWWPVLPLSLEAPEGQRWLYGLLPVVAALGYADMAVTEPPARRRWRTAGQLLAYSLLLLVLAVASAWQHWLQPVAALLAPVGHEWLIMKGNRRETRGEPFYVPPVYGVMVLDTVLDSPARAAGLRSGDVLLRVDEQDISSGGELGEALLRAGSTARLRWQRGDIQIQKELPLPESGRLGVILVPEGMERNVAELTEERFPWQDWWEKRKKGKSLE